MDTPILIDYLRGHHRAAVVLEGEREIHVLHASELTRLEVLSAMLPPDHDRTWALLSTLAWHPVDAEVAEEAGTLGRRWLPHHPAVDGADLAIAATAILLGAELLTVNVGHFPMFPGLRPPY
ncbi:MAG TPA: PIN domain-containing protein [Acidimicrobiales bacterium]|nr:PIN domain-containing protein [Acidimicrobiales bacterium]